MRNGENTRALSTGGRAGGAVTTAGGAGTEVRRLPEPRSLHTVPKRH
jgi:hypothetical protein